MSYAKPALLLIRFLDRIKLETMFDGLHRGTTSIHLQRRSEQARRLRLFAVLFEFRASANPTKPDDLSIRLLTDALPHPDALAAHAAQYKGKSMLTNKLASQEARWQLDSEGNKRDLARLQDLGQKNLKAFTLVRNWVSSLHSPIRPMRV